MLPVAPPGLLSQRWSDFQFKLMNDLRPLNLEVNDLARELARLRNELSALDFEAFWLALEIEAREAAGDREGAESARSRLSALTARKRALERQIGDTNRQLEGKQRELDKKRDEIVGGRRQELEERIRTSEAQLKDFQNAYEKARLENIRATMAAAGHSIGPQDTPIGQDPSITPGSAYEVKESSLKEMSQWQDAINHAKQEINGARNELDRVKNLEEGLSRMKPSLSPQGPVPRP